MSSRYKNIKKRAKTSSHDECNQPVVSFVHHPASPARTIVRNRRRRGPRWSAAWSSVGARTPTCRTVAARSIVWRRREERDTVGPRERYPDSSPCFPTPSNTRTRVEFFAAPSLPPPCDSAFLGCLPRNSSPATIASASPRCCSF